MNYAAQKGPLCLCLLGCRGGTGPEEAQPDVVQVSSGPWSQGAIVGSGQPRTSTVHPPSHGSRKGIV